MVTVKKKNQLGSELDAALDAMTAEQEETVSVQPAPPEGRVFEDNFNSEVMLDRSHKPYEAIDGYHGSIRANTAESRASDLAAGINLLTDKDRWVLKNGETYDVTPEGFLTNDAGRSIAGAITQAAYERFMAEYSRKKRISQGQDADKVQTKKLAFSPAVVK
jgi:hypothetical protein